MSVGGLGPIESAVGAPLPQSKAAEIGRAQSDSAAQSRGLSADEQADRARGIGETDGRELAADERDADGRRPWEPIPAIDGSDVAPEKPAKNQGDSGRLLDLIG